jgi:drug/metabolite transporter (DMT)-like permease
MKKVTNKIVGVLKILTGATAIAVGIIAFITVSKHLDNNPFNQIGNILGLSCFEVYGYCLVYSGWTQTKTKEIKKKYIMWLGVCLGFIMILSFASLFLSDGFQSSELVRIIMIFIVLIFCIQDLQRLRKARKHSVYEKL